MLKKKEQMNKWRIKHNKLKDELAGEPIDVMCKDVMVLHEEVEQWKETAE